jgi:ubiquinone/menaquinone biosynthesis C-methylase UbiE
MKQNKDLLEYYRKRAPIYDEVYSRPIKQLQDENRLVASRLQDFLAERDVLELACGTGYWTKILSQTANRITAIDLLDEMLTLAKEKQYSCPVIFQKANVFQLPYEDKIFTGALANFLFSHIRKEEIDGFITGLHRVLRKGSRVLMVDNNYIPNFGGTLITKKGDQNTYKLRIMKGW